MEDRGPEGALETTESEELQREVDEREIRALELDEVIERAHAAISIGAKSGAVTLSSAYFTAATVVLLDDIRSLLTQIASLGVEAIREDKP